MDLGSSGALVLPDEAGSPAHPHVLFTSGKEGRMYLLDRDALGGVQTGSDSGALASLPDPGVHATFGAAAYFNGSIYIGPVDSPLLAFAVSGASLASSASALTLNQNGYPGATPSISANGSKDGIAWVITADDGGRLLAYDASDLSTLYDSSARSSDQLPGYAEFSVPTIADGKVFAGHRQRRRRLRRIGARSSRHRRGNQRRQLFRGCDLAGITGLFLRLEFVSDCIQRFRHSSADVHRRYFRHDKQCAGAPFVRVAGSDQRAGTLGNRARSGNRCGAKSRSQVRTGTDHRSPSAPGLFTNAAGNAAALNADGSVNSSDKPAVAGSVISVFFTGQGPVTYAVDDGAAPPAGKTDSATSALSATIGGAQAQIQFAGLAPLYPGVAQMNLKVPALASGVYPLILTIGGKAGNTAQLVISGLE